MELKNIGYKFLSRQVLSVLFILFSGVLLAQQKYLVTGTVVDSKNNKIDFASVVLQDQASGKVVSVTADSAGVFCANVASGKYRVEISMLGYVKQYIQAEVYDNTNLGTIVLNDDIKMLKDVKVIANRVEYNMNGYEYAIGNTKALSKKNLTDIIAAAPGLMVTDNVTLYGAPVKNIYVDRRRLQLDDNSILDYLNLLKGENVEKIVVVSNPDMSERHAGTSIRIITKKQQGGMASASARVAGSSSRLILSPNFNINHRYGKFSVYASGSYTYMYNNNKKETVSEWKTVNEKLVETFKDKFTLPLSANAVLGAGYDISKNDYLSLELSYRELKRNNTRESFYQFYSPSLPAEGQRKKENYREYKSIDQRPSVSLMYVHKFTDGAELTVTGDYIGAFKSNRMRDSVPEQYGLLVSNDKVDNNTTSLVGYARYTRKFSKNHTVNVGGKYSFIDDEIDNGLERFRYKERGANPFASYIYNGKKFGVSAGLGAFFVNIGGKSFADLAPDASVSLFLDRKKGHVVKALYNMKVVRPVISALNPNSVLDDQDPFIRIGNPDLESYSVNNFGIDVVLWNRLMLLPRYSFANDAITSYIYSDSNGNMCQTYTNNSKNRNLSLGVNTNMTIKGHSFDLTLNYSNFKNEMGGNSHTYNSFTYYLAAFFQLPKSYKVKCMVMGNTNKVVSYNASRKEPLLVNLSVSKKIKKWTAEAAVHDIFNSNRGRDIKVDMGDFVQRIAPKNSSTSFQFKLSRNFNWGKGGAVKKVKSDKVEMNTRIGE